MDLLYGHDRKLGYLEEPDMIDILNTNDHFLNPMPMSGFPNPEECYESDWFSSILDDPVLNDKMMTDAMQPPCIKSEHSYSINDNNEPGSPLGLAKCDDMETDFFVQSALDLSTKAVSASPAKPSESCLTDSIHSSSSSATEENTIITTATDSSSPSYSYSSSSPSSSSPSTISISPRQPTIIVTTTSTQSACGVSSFFSRDLSFPTIKIKKEPSDVMEQALEQNVSFESLVLPPTPPGSSGSDSDGSQSPQRSAPSSPIHSSSVRHHQAASSSSTSSSLSPSKTYTQPLFVNPISQSGVLILSEEEKRTLISEGYPIPSKLPLTKQEEKNLKKIRRKIKNKISAQESRRKKKEYLEALEKRVESFNHENNDLKKKVENLESNNRSLMGQLQKLQSMVSKMPKATASQTGTALMVLVFCFAVFLGSMSPSSSSLNIGYSNKPRMLAFVPHQQAEIQRTCYGPEMGPLAMGAHDTSDPYSTPTLKSRMLMSVENEEQCDEYLPMPWDASYSSGLCQVNSQKAKAEEEQNMQEPGVDMRKVAATVGEDTKTTPDTTVVMVMAGMENKSDSSQAYQSSVVPGVTVSTRDVMVEDATQASLPADMETA